MNPLHKLLVALALFLAFGKAPPKGHAFETRATDAAADLLKAHDRRPWPKEAAERRLRATMAFGFYESSLLASPHGSNDQGSACGVMQVHRPELDVEGATCTRVRADRVLGWEVGIARLQRLEKKCGSFAAALNAYATDETCRPGVMLDVVSYRCKRAGLDPKTCE